MLLNQNPFKTIKPSWFLRRNFKARRILLGVVIILLGTVQPLYAELKTLKQWGLPEFEPYHRQYSQYMDQSRKIPGKETKFEVYEVGGLMIGVYSIKGKIYYVTADYDHKNPLDMAFIDPDGKGTFEKMAPDNNFKPPDWVFGSSVIQPESGKEINYSSLGMDAAKLNPYKNPDGVLALLEPYRYDEKINSEVFFIQLGLAYQVKKQTQDALQTFLKGEKINPNNPEIIFYLGVSYTWNGDFDLAFRQFQRYKQMVPEKSQRAEKWMEHIKRKIQ